MTDQIEIVINTETGKAKVDVDRLADSFRRAQAAANKTADAMNKSNEQAKKNASTWEILTGKIKDYFTTQNRAARIARRVATIYREATSRLFNYSVAIADVSSNFLGFRNAIQVASGSIDEANRQMAVAADIAKTLKLDITVVTKEYSKFLNAVTLAGQSAEFAEAKFRQFAIAARVLNLSAEATSGMFLALEQMISKETVSLEELRRQLGQHLPGAVAQAARAMGYGEGEIKDFYKAIEEGNVKSAELVDKLGNDVSKRTLPLLEQALKKSSAAITALRNEFTIMQISLGVLLQPAIVAVADVLRIIVAGIRSLLPATDLFNTRLEETAEISSNTANIMSKLAGEENKLASVTDNLSNSFDSIGEKSIYFAGILGTVAIGTTGVVKAIDLLVVAFQRIVGGIAAVLAVLNPYRLAIVAIVTLTGYVVEKIYRWTKATKSANEELKTVKKTTEEVAKTIEQLTEESNQAALGMHGLERFGLLYATSMAKVAIITNQLNMNMLEFLRIQNLIRTSDNNLDVAEYDRLAFRLLELNENFKVLQEELKKTKENAESSKQALEAIANLQSLYQQHKNKPNKDAEEALKGQLREVERLKQAVKDIVHGYDEEQKKIDELQEVIATLSLARQAGIITEQQEIDILYQHTVALEKLNEKIKESAEVLRLKHEPEPDNFEQYMESLKNGSLDMQNIFISAFQNMEDSLVSLVTTGKASFSDMARSIIADIARMAAKQLIYNSILLVTKSLTGFGGGVSRLLGIGGAPVSSIPIPSGTFSSNYGGTSYVSKDGFSYLHKGEAVVPASRNTVNNMQNTRNSKIIININGVHDFNSFKQNEPQMMNALQSRLAFSNRNL